MTGASSREGNTVFVWGSWCSILFFSLSVFVHCNC